MIKPCDLKTLSAGFLLKIYISLLIANYMDKIEYEKKVEEQLKFLGVNLKDLEDEQKKLAKLVSLNDPIMNEIETVAGCYVTYFANKILVAIVVIDKDFEVLEEKFISERAVFPYIPDFVSYRELPVVIKCWEKLEKTPDAVMINRSGILHPRKFGMASHLGISINRPVIGISKDFICGKIKDHKIYLKKEIIGEEVYTKTGGNPVYISPGHQISLKSSLDLTKKFLKEPHKLPEPLDKASRYANSIKEELLKVK